MFLYMSHSHAFSSVLFKIKHSALLNILYFTTNLSVAAFALRFLVIATDVGGCNSTTNQDACDRVSKLYVAQALSRRFGSWDLCERSRNVQRGQWWPQNMHTSFSS